MFKVNVKHQTDVIDDISHFVFFFFFIVDFEQVNAGWNEYLKELFSVNIFDIFWLVEVLNCM